MVDKYALHSGSLIKIAGDDAHIEGAYVSAKDHADLILQLAAAREDLADMFNVGPVCLNCERLESEIAEANAKHYDSVKQFYELAAEHSPLVIEHERLREQLAEAQKEIARCQEGRNCSKLMSKDGVIEQLVEAATKVIETYGYNKHEDYNCNLCELKAAIETAKGE